MKIFTNELEILNKNLTDLSSIDINKINLHRTQVFIVDMNNGFAKSGALYSPRVNNLINPIYNLAKYLCDKVKNITAFTDCHSMNSTELLNYPQHCLDSTLECEIVDELKSLNNINIVKKNSTNGFFALDCLDFDNVDNFIIIGNCTDICVYQLAITLKSYFNEKNINKNIIVPIDLVDTYNIDGIHCADLLNIVFLNSLVQNGVNVVKSLNY